MIEIKKASAIDGELVAAISRETFYDTFAAHNTKKDMDLFLSAQFSEQQLIAEVNQKENIFLLAYLDEQCAGYVFLKEDLTDKNAIEISRLYARLSFIGKGIGKALMQAAIAFAEKHTKQKIWLGVWEHNHRAIDFYISFGFVKTGEHPFILGEDMQTDWLMCKSIS